MHKDGSNTHFHIQIFKANVASLFSYHSSSLSVFSLSSAPFQGSVCYDLCYLRVGEEEGSSELCSIKGILSDLGCRVASLGSKFQHVPAAIAYNPGHFIFYLFF